MVPTGNPDSWILKRTPINDGASTNLIDQPYEESRAKSNKASAIRQIQPDWTILGGGLPPPLLGFGSGGELIGSDVFDGVRSQYRQKAAKTE